MPGNGAPHPLLQSPGTVVVLGISPVPVPSAHQWVSEFGGVGVGGMSLSSTISFPVEPKKEGVGAGRAGAQGGCPKPQPQRNSLGWSGSLFHPVSWQLGEMSRETGGECRSC